MSENGLDEDGQPPIQFGWDRLQDSRTDELIGLCRGILADGALVLPEARYLHRWLKNNRPILYTPHGRKLYESLDLALHDGELSHEEEDGLIDLLLAFTGDRPGRGSHAGSTRLPFDDPPPEVIFLAKAFCFTGKFTFGTRKTCENTVITRCGAIHKSPTHATHFLVVGELGSVHWIHSNSGRKIEKAIELRDSGREIRLVGEAHFCAALGCA